ncbi:MAG TPA: DUF4178 domain-containing protein [Telluria sp.]|nr:DUF4178 domain-containing protein [Telluria sp.]
MQTVSCPSCGAPVEFRSHASVMAVCGYCNTTVLKEADAVKDIGKMSAVLEDYSPIQIGTSGVAGGRGFNVAGRIQLRYDAGMWNEWFLVFDDGATGWLGDSSGLYTLTMERPAGGVLPAFDAIAPGRLYQIDGATFTASEKRTARCTGGQGELPFRVGEGWEARVADFRSGAQFVTLDYSDGDAPVVYNGTAVTLEELKCQLLRDDEAIKSSAGRYRGKLDALDCPSCGTQIKYLPGVTTSLVCPACATQLDAAGPKAQVVAAGEKLEAVRTTLMLGAEGKINGQDYRVIGAMVRADDEGSEWTEYLLYNTRNAFFWLVETDDGWWRANVMHEWPAWNGIGTRTVSLKNASFDKLYDYPATVKWAAGAFNWRVSIGDLVQVSEYEHAPTRLAAELTQNELTWSSSTRVAFDQVKAWFGIGVRPEARRSGSAPVRTDTIVKGFLWAILALNFIPVLFNFGGSIIYPILGALAIYLPSQFMDIGGKGDE